MEYHHPSANKFLQYDITKLDNKLIPPGFRGDLRSTRMMQDSLSKVIDMLGEQSAAAQGLKKVITTAEKLRNSPGHTLYLLKDAHANRRQRHQPDMERHLRVRAGVPRPGAHQVPGPGRGHVRGPQLHRTGHLPHPLPAHRVPQRTPHQRVL